MKTSGPTKIMLGKPAGKTRLRRRLGQPGKSVYSGMKPKTFKASPVKTITGAPAFPGSKGK